MMAESIPDLQFTPVAQIPEAAARVRKAFWTHKTKDVEYRLIQLRKLWWGVKDNQDRIAAALAKDIGKSTFEAHVAEIGWVLNDIMFMTSHLKEWAKDESPPYIPLMNKALSPKIRKEPLGAVLIIGPYNYPFSLSVCPLIGAISAGCTAVVKPSENAPAAAVIIQEIVEKYLDSSAYTAVQGGVEEATALLNEKWDRIFYTGNGNVAKIIAKKAAETLTPVTLELGGNNPAIVTRKADVRLAARRLLWAKVHNAGQVCVSQNYILVDREVLPMLIEELKKAFKEYFPKGARESSDLSKIINERQWRRLKEMLDNSKEKILIGGEMDENTKFLEPTVVQVDDYNDSLMAEESFGPLIPIHPVKDLDEAIRIAQEISDTSLGIYPFGDKQETQRILNETRSGGASVNDAFFHASIPTLSFGGVGQSGTGAYRGKASFDEFTHRRSVTSTPAWLESLLAVRYPPYAGKLARWTKMSAIKPNFDREGRVKTNWLGLIFGLGAGSAGGAVRRYLMVLLVGIAVKYYQK